MAYFACRNGNSGGVSGVGSITVEAVEGSVLTCTKDQTVLTQTVGASEEVVFEVPESGDWVVSDGAKSKTITIVPQDYNTNFKFNPVLYELGTFNAEYENPGDFKSGNTTTYVETPGSESVSSNKIICYTGSTKKAYRCLGFSNKIDFTPYSYVRIYTDQNLVNYIDVNVASVNEEGFLVIHSGNNSTSCIVQCVVSREKQRYFTTYIAVQQLKKTNATSPFNYEIFKIELLE